MATDPVLLAPPSHITRADSPMTAPTQGEAPQSPPRSHATTLRDSLVPKSASYTYLPTLKDSTYNKVTAVPLRIRTDHSTEDLRARFDINDVSSADSSGWTTPSDDIHSAVDPVEGLSARLDVVRKSSFEESTSITSSEKSRSIGETSQDAGDEQPSMQTTPAKSLAMRLGRRMSLYRSRSPSPTKAGKQKREAAGTGASSSTERPAPPRRSRSALSNSDDKVDAITEIPATKQPATLERSITSASKKENKTANRPSRINLHASFSTDKLPSVVEIHEDNVPLPSPRIQVTERNSSVISLGLPKKRDELWSIFRSLDGDFTKFSSKSTPFKANVIRQSLLPFLRNYADHPTNHSLRAEDLNRRVAILNKWWVGLLELLHGRHNQSMSGTDRPTILDALSGIMERPEWRPALSIYAPLSYRNKPSTVDTARKSTTSLASSGSDFLTESVLHNVRNLFVQNLTTQMSFVAEKMSLRNASASLITFCGKAIAWAFFFCPGIADVLVREWNIGTDTLKRVLQTHSVSKFDNLKDISEDISISYPPAIRSLTFVSLAKLLRSLKEPAQLPPMSAELQMYGFWRDRWLGRESDLFYVFVKHYFILSQDYMPPGTDEKQRITAPGMVLVQAQVLANLDSTINRNTASNSDNLESPSPTFDDLLGGPDAVVSSLPILPPNATRIMSENRLIMLIRDFLSDRMADHSAARHLFALTFCNLLAASAKATSTFNHSACYTLCDFLEEALVIINRYEASTSCPEPVLDFDFWLDVFRQMLRSNNTVTEIRIFAFLYSSWNQLCSNQKRRDDLCLELLLSPDLFESSFTHWCPMVRAYFMRLVCWRLARYDEDSEPAETQIVSRVCERLQSMWSYHLYDSTRAEDDSRPPPTVTPCNPAPGRRFLIVRTDTQIAPGGAFLAFNGISPPPPSGIVERSSATPTDGFGSRPLSVASSTSEMSLEEEPITGLRGFLRGIMGTRKRSVSRDRKPPAEPERPRDRQALAKAAEPAFRNYCFKFSLEFAARTRPRNLAHAPPARLAPPRMPGPAQQLLPEFGEVQPQRPQGQAKMQYVGRALAEWQLVVAECQGFCERRLQEGVPRLRDVETPTLGVESFKKSV